MNNEGANQLRALLKQYGTSLCDDPRRCRSLMMDLFGENQKEIKVLCMALESNIPRELILSKDIPYNILRARFTQNLVSKYGMSEDVAFWSIDAWASALDMQVSFSPDTIDQTVKENDDDRSEKIHFSSDIEPAMPRVVKETSKRVTGKQIARQIFNIDYTSGSMPVGDLIIGSRIIDPTWEWEFRSGENYTHQTGHLDCCCQGSLQRNRATCYPFKR